ncbi:Tetratricopeptide repeat-containing protein [Desulfocicer vacuolatum DSM 3385]|uniref:Tetratricopeptide repeat-containing protein n=1 Tax=Desulfocicer vacuolatum DSM 3385 TaxID=1121400 RepID=A0A1W1ZVH3_9BACT|nr:tetratricopeptide repeat protein [Desulfocicer vacuolatum]SMC52058.1 Tetratricopeptide repeat-containing protein [Desulfocicer vacuolatum DSM 3385]
MSEKISNARKKELEQPDPILEALYKGVALARAYQKQLIWTSCAIFAVIIIVSGTIYSINASDEKASVLLSQALETYSTMAPAEGYEAVHKDLNKLMEEYPNTGAGKMGRVRFAEICYDAGKFDKALTLYQGVLADFSHDPIMENLIQVALGHTCQMLENDDRATEIFKAVLQGKSAFLKDEALFNLGLLAEKAGKDDQSSGYFNQILSDHPQSIYATVARSRVGKNNS